MYLLIIFRIIILINIEILIYKFWISFYIIIWSYYFNFKICIIISKYNNISIFFSKNINLKWENSFVRDVIIRSV